MSILRDRRNGERAFVIVPNIILGKDSEDEEFFNRLGERVDALHPGTGGYTAIMLAKVEDGDFTAHDQVRILVSLLRLGNGSVALVDIRGEEWRQNWEIAQYLHETGLRVILLSGVETPREIRDHVRVEGENPFAEKRYSFLSGEERHWIYPTIQNILLRDIEEQRRIAIPDEGVA
jgi:hypothetical protein